MKYCMIIVALMSACVFARPAPKPVPQAGERVAAFVAHWDAWVDTISEDQKAWELMLEVDEVVKEAQGDGHWFASGPPSETNEYNYEDDMKYWSWTVEFIGENSELLEKIREYADREYAGLPLNDSSWLHREQLAQVSFPSTFDDLAPRHFRMMRSHLEVLLADMYLANQAGESGRVVQDMKAVVGMARLSLVTGSMLDQLVVKAFASTIIRRLQEQAIDLDQFSDVHLATIQEIVHEIQGLYAPESSLQYERIAKHEFLDWIFADSHEGLIGSQGRDRLKATGSVAATSGVIALESMQHQYVDAYFDAVEVDLNVPLHEMHSWTSLQISQSFGDDIEARFGPALHELEFKLPYYLSNTPSQFNAIQLLLALHRHKLRHNEFPADLAAIDRDLLSNPPIDTYSGQPLKYKLIDGEPMIYSVGTDRDDDGGHQISGNENRWASFLTLNELEAINKTDPASIDGDWILYPAIP